MFFRKYVLRWQAVAIIIGMLAIIFLSVKFYRMANQEPETNVTYGMPKYKDTAELEVNVLPGKPPPKPEAAYNEFIQDIVEQEIEGFDEVSDDEVEEFLDLVRVAMEEPEDSEPVDMMKLNPDQMVDYLNENYTHREQHDFLMSSSGEDWIRYAFDAPPIQTPSTDSCREQYPNEVAMFNSCMEEQHRLAIAPYRKQLSNSIERLMDFFSQLDPTVFSFSRNDVGASILPAPVPLEAPRESEF